MKTQPLARICCTLAVITILGCGADPAPPGQPEAPPAVSSADPETAPKTRVRTRPTATLPDGFVVTLELAASDEEIAQGLMYRAALPEDRGMLFLLQYERAPSFWMKNTMVPLDIIFLDGDGTVVDVTHDARPCRADPCPQYVSKAAAVTVLEVLSGTAKAHGVEEGSVITFTDVPGHS